MSVSSANPSYHSPLLKRSHPPSPIIVPKQKSVRLQDSNSSLDNNKERRPSLFAPLYTPKREDFLGRVGEVADNCLLNASMSYDQNQYALPGEIARFGDSVGRLVRAISFYVRKTLKNENKPVVPFRIKLSDLEVLKECENILLPQASKYLEAQREISEDLSKRRLSVVLGESEKSETPLNKIEDLKSFIDKFNDNPQDRPEYIKTALSVIAQVKSLSWTKYGDLRVANIERLSGARSTCKFMLGCSDLTVRGKVLKTLISLLDEGAQNILGADGLVELQMDLLDHIKLPKAEQLPLQVQRLLIQAYAMTTSNLLINTPLLNGLMSQTKENIRLAACDLAKLNVNRDPEMAFWADYAQQAAQRLVSGDFDLCLDTIVRISSIGINIASIAASPSSATSSLTSIASDLKVLFDRMPNKMDWFDELMPLARLLSIGTHEPEVFSVFLKRCQRYIDISADVNLRYGIVALLARAIKKTTSQQVIESGLKILLQMLEIDDSRLQIRILEALDDFIGKRIRLSNTVLVLFRIFTVTNDQVSKEVEKKLKTLGLKATSHFSLQRKNFSSDECLRSVLFYEIMRQLKMKGDHETGGSQLVTAIVPLSASKHIRKKEQLEKICLLIGIISELFNDPTTDIYGNTPYHIAVTRARELTLLPTIFEKVRCDIDQRDNNKKTVLQYAVEMGDEKAVRMLTGYKASHEISNGDGDAPIHYVVRKQELSMLKVLIECNTDVNLVNAAGLTPLDIALRGHDVEIVDYLISEGGVVSLFDTGRTPISEAAELKNEVILKHLMPICSLTTFDVAQILRMISQDSKTLSCSEEFAKFHLHLCSTNELYGKTFRRFSSWAAPKIQNGIVRIIHPSVALPLLVQLAKKKLKATDAEWLDILTAHEKYWAEEDCLGNTPLLYCARFSTLNQFLKVLTEKVDVLHSNYLKINALHICSLSGNTEGAMILLRAGIGVDSVNFLQHTSLHMACARADAKMVKLLLDAGASVNKVTALKIAPIHVLGMPVTLSKPELKMLGLALELDEVFPNTNRNSPKELFDLLKTKGCDILLQDIHGKTALHYAVETSDIEFAEALIEHDPRVMWQENNRFQLPVEVAMEEKNIGMVQAMIHAYPKVSLGEFSQLFKMKLNGRLTLGALLTNCSLIDLLQELFKEDRAFAYELSDDATPLHIAAQEGDTDVLRIYINSFLSLEEKDLIGNSASHYAALKMKSEFLDLMSDCKSALEVQNRDGRTPLHLAAAKGFECCVRVLLSHDVNVLLRDGTGNTPLHMAAIYGRSKDGERVIQLLLKKCSALLEMCNENGKTALHLAAGAGHLNATKSLLECGADINFKDSFGMTPLQCAAQEGHGEVVSFLIEENADILSQDTEGETALHKAAYNGFQDIAKILFESEEDKAIIRDKLLYVADVEGENAFHEIGNGCGNSAFFKMFIDQLNLNPIHPQNKIVWAAKDKKGERPLHKASAAGHLELVNYILTLGPQFIDSVNERGMTPLHLAVEKGYNDIASDLLAAGANVHAKQKDGKTPLQIALLKADGPLVYLLIRNKANIYESIQGGGSIVHLILSKEHLKNEDEAILSTLLYMHPGFLAHFDHQKRSAFHLAAENNHRAALPILMGWLKKRLIHVLQAENKDKMTAADVADEAGFKEFKGELISFKKSEIGFLYRNARPNGRAWWEKLVKGIGHMNVGRALFSTLLDNVVYVRGKGLIKDKHFIGLSATFLSPPPPLLPISEEKDIQ